WDREQRRAHAEARDVRHRERRRGLQVAVRTGHLRVQEQLLDRTRAERDHDRTLDLAGMRRITLFFVLTHDHTERVTHADDRGLLDALFGHDVVRDDGVPGLVVRDGAALVGTHLADRLLQAELARITG